MLISCLLRSLLGLAYVALASAAPAVAQKSTATPAQTVRITLAEPNNPEDAKVRQVLEERGWLSPIRTYLDSFRLKRPVTLALRSCPGYGGAWYEDDTVTVCYRYLGNIVRHASRAERPAWVSEPEAIAGGVVDVFFHEFAHALLDQHAIPILGREEDAADQIAGYMMLSRGGAEAAGLVKGTAYLYLRWFTDYGDGRWRTRDTLRTGARAFAAEPHGSFDQRFYNIVCLAYGADEAAFASLATAADLPKDRAEGCSEEYELVRNAWTKLIAAHVDGTKAAAARSKSLLAPFTKAGG